MTNELMNVKTGEMIKGDVVVRENEDMVVVQKADGKFVRQAKYKDFHSFVPQTTEEKIELFNIMNAGEEESDNGLSSNVGKKITIRDIVQTAYDKVNEDTGELEHGVVTYLFTPENEVFVTSSKSVHFTLSNLFKVFGNPADKENYVPIIVEVTSTRRENGKQINVKLVGVAE